MGKWGWFSANEEGKVVSKTEVHEDGKVSKYEYTKEDDISKGHGHKEYNDMNDFMNDKPSREPRDKSAVASINRRWKGNGYNLGMKDFSEMNIEELYSMKKIVNDMICTNTELIIEEVMKLTYKNK